MVGGKFIGPPGKYSAGQPTWTSKLVQANEGVGPGLLFSMPSTILVKRPELVVMCDAVVGLPIVESCMMGYNASIFAYGMTGAGKTFTMLGSMSAPEQVAFLCLRFEHAGSDSDHPHSRTAW